MRHKTSGGQRVPISIHLIAIFYVLQAAALAWIFVYTRSEVSSALVPADIITVLLFIIPLIALWSIYRPNRYIRWFPLYSILLIWIIVLGISSYLQYAWLAMGGYNDTTDIVVSVYMTYLFLMALSVWMLIAFWALRLIPSARQYQDFRSCAPYRLNGRVA